jgi:hypothetical protein
MSVKIPRISQTAKVGASVAGLAIFNSYMYKKMVHTESDLANFGMVAGILIPIAAIADIDYHPNVAGGILGATLGSLITGIAAVVTKDVTLVSSSPKMTRQLTGELAGLPDNFALALVGK